MLTPEQFSIEEIHELFEKYYGIYQRDTPKRIRNLRSREDMSKTQLAKLAGISPQNLGKMEKDYGDTNGLNPSFSFMCRVAIIFNVDLNYLAGFTNEPSSLPLAEFSKLNKGKTRKSAEVSLPDDKLDQLIEINKKMYELMKQETA